MAKIGSFGGVNFEVSSKKVLNFSEFSRSGSSRWSIHDINLKKPMPEFLGPGQDSLSLKIKLNAYHGVNPESTLKKLRDFKDKGKYGSFVIGTEPISSNYWYLEDVSEVYNNIDGKGRIISIEATLSIKEYPKPVAANVKKKVKFKKTGTNTSKKKVLGTITIKASMLNCRASPSLKGKVVKVLKKNQKYKVYGTKKTDITWYNLGGGKWVSSSTKYVSFKKE